LNQTISAIEKRLKCAFSSSNKSCTIPEDVPHGKPPVALWTIRDAYGLLEEWLAAKEFQEVVIFSKQDSSH